MITSINKQKILTYIKENNLTKEKFCKKCSISTKTLAKILEQENNCYVISLFKIARVMNVQICNLV